jgi:hypothetical protein
MLIFKYSKFGNHVHVNVEWHRRFLGKVIFKTHEWNEFIKQRKALTVCVEKEEE